jgi:hypothetical protein
MLISPEELASRRELEAKIKSAAHGALRNPKASRAKP